MKHIDPHVHCRDWEQSQKATIKSVCELARKQGIVAIFDMPNTKPPITSEELVEKRLELAKKENCLDMYFLYIGATQDPHQIEECVEVVKSNPKVVGIKMYAGKSVGDLTISEEKDQLKVYEWLSKCKYTGVLAVHCEKENLFKLELFDPDRPATWNLARPVEAEVESVKDQIKFAKRAGFKGTLHVCHVSAPQTVDVIEIARNEINITCGVTPHHLLYSTSDMKGREGLMLKVNPPLRDERTVKLLRRYLKQEKIDWIESDHAPHTRDDKMLRYSSGIPSLNYYSEFLERLKVWGFTEDQIKKLTYKNIKRVFKDKLFQLV